MLSYTTWNSRMSTFFITVQTSTVPPGAALHLQSNSKTDTRQTAAFAVCVHAFCYEGERLNRYRPLCCRIQNPPYQPITANKGDLLPQHKGCALNYFSFIFVSFAAWSAAVRLSIISSRSPFSTPSRRWSVSLILWSVTRPWGKL